MSRPIPADPSAQLSDTLERERDFFTAVIASMGEGVIVLNERGEVILLNPVAEYILDILAARAQGKKWWEFFSIWKSAVELPTREGPISAALSSGQANILGQDANIFLGIKMRSKRVPITLAVTPMLRGSHISGAVVVFRDITEERELDEAKSSFISIASHQLRVPLTTMRWYSEMLAAGDAGELMERQREFAEAIESGAEHMVSLLDTLLQIARVEADRVQVNPRPTDFKQLTQEVIMSMSSTFDKKRQQVVIDTSSNLPEVSMDQEIAWQVIQNLLSNASRYSPDGKNISVDISLDDAAEELVYSVRDRGIGIPAHEREHIFEKFYRAPNAVRYAPEGTGLGLNLAKQLVEKWGGKIWVESEEGTGSTFSFTVPLHGVSSGGEVKLTD